MCNFQKYEKKSNRHKIRWLDFCPKMRVDDEICIYFYDVLSFSDSGSGVFSADESVCGVSERVVGKGVSRVGTTI